MAATLRLEKSDLPLYTFTSLPKMVNRPRHAYENQEDEIQRYTNLMHERRALRGGSIRSTLSNRKNINQELEMLMKSEKEKVRRFKTRTISEISNRMSTPEPVDGRKHMDMQTEAYLEELTDQVDESDMGTQTDPFLERPSTPLFMPAKTGVDVSTQILEGELFDFDMEVRPILEVLVGKNLAQAQLEVMEEEELSALREQQRRYEALRDAELFEVQRLEQQDRRLREEKERRMRQQKEIRRKEKETAEKIAALAYAKSYVRDLIPAVLRNLTDSGFFFDTIARASSQEFIGDAAPVASLIQGLGACPWCLSQLCAQENHDMEVNFLPWVMTETRTIVDRKLLARMLLDKIIRDVVKNRLQHYDKLDEHDREKKAIHDKVDKEPAFPTLDDAVLGSRSHLTPEPVVVVLDSSIPDETPSATSIEDPVPKRKHALEDMHTLSWQPPIQEEPEPDE